jgi:hypothetical protein
VLTPFLSSSLISGAHDLVTKSWIMKLAEPARGNAGGGGYWINLMVSAALLWLSESDVATLLDSGRDGRAKQALAPSPEFPPNTPIASSKRHPALSANENLLGFKSGTGFMFVNR